MKQATPYSNEHRHARTVVVRVATCFFAGLSVIAEPVMIEGVRIDVQPGQAMFQVEDHPFVTISVKNTTDGTRHLGVATLRKPGESPGSTTVIRTGAGPHTIEGLPGYLHIQCAFTWDARVNEAGYSDRYSTSLPLQANQTMTFDVAFPQTASNRARPTGCMDVFSRFAVRTKEDGPFTIKRAQSIICLTLIQIRGRDLRTPQARSHSSASTA